MKTARYALAMPLDELATLMVDVDAEIEALRGNPESYLEGTGFVGRGFGVDRFFPILSASSQNTLVAYHQTTLALKEDDEVADQGGAAVARHLRNDSNYTALLLGSVYRLLRSLVRTELTQHYGSVSPALLDDMYGAAYVTSLEAIATFDPTKMPVFANWVAERVVPVVRATYQKDRSSGVLGRIEQRVLRRLQSAQVSLTSSLQRTPTRAELFAHVRAASVQWNMDRLRSRERDLDAEELRTRVDAAMKRSGETAVLAERLEILCGLMVSADTHFGDVVRPDTGTYHTTIDESLVDTRGADANIDDDRLATLVAFAFHGCSDEEKSALFHGLETGNELSLARSEVRRAKARLVAPHAQFAWMAASLDQQFVEPELAPTALVAQRARHKQIL